MYGYEKQQVTKRNEMLISPIKKSIADGAFIIRVARVTAATTYPSLSASKASTLCRSGIEAVITTASAFLLPSSPIATFATNKEGKRPQHHHHHQRKQQQQVRRKKKTKPYTFF
ncbi:hypothetical protein GQX74_010048 [Glossina fuscipes]|nr:hypothetical protein GQX74_010048 [Glossina fuscipes]